jgi:integrase
MSDPERATSAVLVRPRRASTSALNLAEAASAYAREARAASTHAVYAKHWRSFVAWCVERGFPALPTSPQAVCMYLAARAQEGRRVATLALIATSISQAHQRAGHESPCRHALVRETWKGIRRAHGVAQAQKAPLSPLELRVMLDPLTDCLAGKRDRALLLLGFAGGFRRSEIVGLDRADLVFVREGLECTLRRSKTDQEGRGHVKVIAYGSDPALCPVRAVEDWLTQARIHRGAVFRRVRKNGLLDQNALTGHAVALVIKRCARRVGLDPALYSGHSLRAGFVTEAKRNGADDAAIMDQTGHRSLAMVHRYHRRTRAWDRPASAKLGL